MARRGIDVSHWQGKIDWARVAADDVAFAMCKATEAAKHVDKRWRANRAGAHAAGIPVGAYHFARPGRVSAAASARHHLEHAHPTDDELVPALDLEDTDLGPADTTRWALEWLSIVEEAIGATPVVYTGPGWASTHLRPDPALLRHPLWVAHYTRKPAPRLPEPWGEWMWWQHTDKGPVAGIAGGVDTNRGADLGNLPLCRAGARVPHPTEEPLMVTDSDKQAIRDLLRAELGAHGMAVVAASAAADDAELTDVATLARRAYAYSRAVGQSLDGELPEGMKVRERAAQIDKEIRDRAAAQP